MTHPSLPDLRPEQARDELERSRVVLAELIGRDVRELSFPYGAHDKFTITLCREAFYETVYSITPEEIDTTCQAVLRGRTKTDPSHGPLEFFLKFNGAYEWMRYQAASKQALRSMFMSGRPLSSRIGPDLIDDELGR